MQTKMQKSKQIKKSVYVKNFETKCILGIYPKEKKYPQILFRRITSDSSDEIMNFYIQHCKLLYSL